MLYVIRKYTKQRPVSFYFRANHFLMTAQKAKDPFMMAMLLLYHHKLEELQRREDPVILVVLPGEHKIGKSRPPVPRFACRLYVDFIPSHNVY